jgi:putative ABC transport system permease protein
MEVLRQYGRFAVAPANFLDWRNRNQVFDRIAAYTTVNDTFIDRDGPERIPGALVSWDTFELLGVAPMLGRGFREEEDLPQQNGVIVISHGMWQRRFGSDPGILGRTISLSGAPVTIVGVMPAGFYFAGRTTEFWRPLALDRPNSNRGGHFLQVIARLKQGVSLQQAESEMRGIATQLAQQYPDTNADESADTVLLHDLIVGPFRPMLLTLLAAVGIVVLIACANVAHLLLVRASVRERELAIRTAMGAGRGRLVLQMIAESLVLAVAGGAAGLLLAYLAIGPIQTLGAASLPRVADITLDRTVLAFAFVVTIATGFVFGLAPAWQAARGGVAAVLKESGRSTGGRGHRVRGLLLVAEVALSLVLLVGAALLIRSFARLTNVDPGFASKQVLSFQVMLPQTAYPDNARRDAFFDRLLERLQGTPGVRAAGMTQTLPILADYTLAFSIQGRPPVEPGRAPSANFRVASPGYFESLAIPVRRGRTFTARDTATAPMVAVIDEAFAQRHFPGQDPIGGGIDIGNGGRFYEIVGVVGSVRHEGLNASPRPTMYIPYKQEVFSSMVMMVRTHGDPAQFAGTARQIVRAIDPALPAFDIAPLSSVITRSVAPRRFSMLLLGMFALVALFLAAVGLYGVVAYAVSQRTQEIGIRIAVGAQRGDVLRLVLGGGMKLAALGVAIGAGGALALSSYVESMLFDVGRFDTPSYIATAAVLLGVSALACYVPARRAMRVDPLVALRAE